MSQASAEALNIVEREPAVTGPVFSAESGQTNRSAQHGSFAVHLDFFEGPMDLLLHLVQQREVSLERVDLSEVCEQYLAIVSTAHFIDLERASEYLVIAATLLSMKSQALLPSEAGQNFDELGEGADPAFYAALRERLRVYELTKMRAESLLSRPQLGRTAFARPTRALQVTPLESEESDMELGDAVSLGTLFLQLMKRIGSSVTTLRIALEPISIVSYMMKVVDALRVDSLEHERSRAPRSFLEIIRGMLGGRDTRPESARAAVLGGFLALLELMKRGIVTGRQDDEQIELVMNFEPAPDAVSTDSQSEFDTDDLPSDSFVTSEELSAKVLSLDSMKGRKDAADFDPIDEPLARAQVTR